VSAAAQDKKLHQLSAPLRNSIAAGEPDYAPLSAGGSGGAGGSSSSWDENEVARQMALLTEERNFLRKYGAPSQQTTRMCMHASCPLLLLRMCALILSLSLSVSPLQSPAASTS
jgi:hypothetical protein